jgi:hypothetical protein
VDGRPAPGIAQPLVAPLQLVEHARHHAAKAGFYRERPTVEVRLSMTSARAPRDDGADLMLSWDRSQAGQECGVCSCRIRVSAQRRPPSARTG